MHSCIYHLLTLILDAPMLTFRSSVIGSSRRVCIIRLPEKESVDLSSLSRTVIVLTRHLINVLVYCSVRGGRG